MKSLFYLTFAGGFERFDVKVDIDVDSAEISIGLSRIWIIHTSAFLYHQSSLLLRDNLDCSFYP
jgi:hypothetical protein